MQIRRATEKDIEEMRRLNQECFSAHRDNSDLAILWLKCNFARYPWAQFFVSEDESGKITGYILWVEKGIIRKEVVFELEQIGVTASQRGGGIGTALIKETLPEIKKHLKSQGRALKLVEVTTGTGNEAQRLYKKTLGAEPVCIIPDLYRGDELIMIARNP